MANITQINVNGTTYDIKDANAGNVGHDDSASAGSAVPINADQLGGYSLLNLLKLIYPVGSVYLNINNINPSSFITGTTWELISSVGLASNHVFGNGIALGLSNGTNKFGFQRNAVNTSVNGGLTASDATFGGTVGTSQSGNNQTTSVSAVLGVITKTEAGDNPEYSGIIADTITLYTWKRTA